MSSSHLILCHPLLLLPPIPPSITVFSNESTLRMRWPKCWSFSFSISPSNEHPGLISFRMDWLDHRNDKKTWENNDVQSKKLEISNKKLENIKYNQTKVKNTMCVLSRSVVSDSFWPYGLSPSGSSVHEDSPGKNTEVGCHFLLHVDIMLSDKVT